MGYSVGMLRRRSFLSLITFGLSSLVREQRMLDFSIQRLQANRIYSGTLSLSAVTTSFKTDFMIVNGVFSVAPSLVTSFVGFTPDTPRES